MTTVVPPELEPNLRRLMQAFLEENTKLNLSAFRTEEACWTGNILDSIAAVPLLKKLGMPQTDCRAMDLGTGGGFPLLPLAMAFPEWQWTGLDATKKKMDAVQRIVDAMGIKNVKLLAERAEVSAREKSHREQYHLVTARAVAEISVLLEYCVPFVRIGGRVVLWKSMEARDELQASIRAQKELRCRSVETATYDLGPQWGKRQLLVFEKTAATPGTYPRETGTPKKSPL